MVQEDGLPRRITDEIQVTVEIRIDDVASRQSVVKTGGNSQEAFVTDWATRLARNPNIRLSILVHGGGPDRAKALQSTDAAAKAWRTRLVDAGVNADQLVPLGMGVTELDLGPDTMRAEIERLQ